MEIFTPSLYFPNVSTAATLTDKEFHDRSFDLFQIIAITIHSIICILGIVGNGLVIWIIGFKMEKTATLIWFLNLGISDFSFCLFLSFSMLQGALPYNWLLGWIMCKTWAFNLYLNLSTSVLFLLIISIDRCICVLYPIWAKIHRTARLASVTSVIIWIISVALNFPYFIIHDYREYENWPSCSPEFDRETRIRNYKAMIMTKFVSMFLIPFSIMLVCYGLIAFRVKSSRIPGSGRTLKIIFTIVICFFFCWIPFHIIHMIDYADIDIGYPCSAIFYTLAESLAFFNSCLNPIIYVFIGRDFKKSLRKSILFLLESTFRESNDPPEMLNKKVSETEKLASCV
ncbi:hypothetical protein XENTR_v10019530 [Xenopus tropicalis]|nr:hypothetical protein XENTR_v10019530 [Xenopus tropicalis]